MVFVDWMYATVKELMSTGKYKNGVLIGYKDLCCDYITVSKILTPKIGKYLAKQLDTLQLDPTQAHFFAHSLGNHMVYALAKALKSNKKNKIDKIFGKLTFMR